MTSDRKIFIDADPSLRPLLQEGLERHALLDCVTFEQPTDGQAAAVIAATSAEKFRLGAFLDRVRAHLRAPVRVTWPRNTAFDISPWRFLPEDSSLARQDKPAVRLTEKERDILAYLCQKRGSVTDRTSLLRTVWGYGPAIETHTLETHIYRLRQKIESDPAKPGYLLTEEDGYRIV